MRRWSRCSRKVSGTCRRWLRGPGSFASRRARGTRCLWSGSCPRIAHRSRGTRCSRSGSCRRAAPASGAFRRSSPADSPVGALAHRGAPLAATHSICNGSNRRRGPADPAVRPALHLGAHAVSPAPCNGSPTQAVSALQPRRLACTSFRSAMRKGTRLGASGAGGCKTVPLGATHSNCNGSKRRRSSADSSVGHSAPPESHVAPPARAD